MLTLLTYVMTAGTVILCIPVAMLAVEIAAAIVLKERAPTDDCSPRSRLAVLIPAHDEGDGLRPTLADVQAQMRSGDRVLVVADNCTDNTAAIARSAGAEVVERHDPERFGKGFAIDYGLMHLESDPPKIVVMVDADCRLTAHTLDWLARCCSRTGRPAQALYQMTQASAEGGAEGQRVAQFAWIIKTYVRPLGLAKLGLPCQLMGTGMAFPWQAVRTVELASGNLVEDLKLGLDLAANGMAPRFCSQACVTSTFPTSESGQLTQRQRWEVGSLRMAVRAAPLFLWKAFTSRNLPLAVLALDTLVPPLVILATVLLAYLCVAGIAAVAGIAVAPLIIATAISTLFVMTVLLAWAVFARSILRLRDTGQLITYALQKLRIYRPGQAREWIRTDRQ